MHAGRSFLKLLFAVPASTNEDMMAVLGRLCRAMGTDADMCLVVLSWLHVSQPRFLDQI